MNLELIYFEDDVAENLMEAFRLYGSKNRYENWNPWIVYGIADKEKNLFFTRGFAKGNADEREYIFSYGNSLGQVNCSIMITSEKAEKRWINHVKRLEILDIKGNTELDRIQAEEMIRFYEESKVFEFEQQLLEKLRLKGPLLTDLNVLRQHEMILKNKQKWENRNELLAEDFIFESLCENDKMRFMDCINKYSVDYKYCQNANMDFYMTDRDHSFKMVQCAYISDGIKCCDEPDDYEYAVITENTSGTVLIWNCDDFRITNGEIPIQCEKLVAMFRYYSRFYYSFTSMLKK